jgi:hypothetical protein
MALDPAFKAAWVKALRENKHRQCFGDLWDGNGNACALGVGYEVLGYPTRAAMRTAFDKGVHPALPGLDQRDSERIAFCMNDKEKQPLDVIAAYIEQNL